MSQEEFRFRSGRLCLDFAATLGGRYRGGTERLREPGDLARWLRLALPFAGDIRVTGRDVAAATGLREAIYRLIHPATCGEPAPADIALVNDWAARPGFRPQLGPDARTVVLLAASPAEAGLATVARDTVDLLSGPWLSRVRECARPDCSLLFVDLSRPGQRRWCDMGSCGNVTKVRRHRMLHGQSAPA